MTGLDSTFVWKIKQGQSYLVTTADLHASCLVPLVESSAASNCRKLLSLPHSDLQSIPSRLQKCPLSAAVFRTKHSQGLTDIDKGRKVKKRIKCSQDSLVQLRCFECKGSKDSQQHHCFRSCSVNVCFVFTDEKFAGCVRERCDAFARVHERDVPVLQASHQRSGTRLWSEDQGCNSPKLFAFANHCAFCPRLVKDIQKFCLILFTAERTLLGDTVFVSSTEGVRGSGRFWPASLWCCLFVLY